MTNSPDPRQFAATRACGLLDTLDFALRRVLKKPEDSQVHDLRVAIRRFGQALEVFECCFGSAAVERIERKLDTVMKLAGKVRDSDIVLKMLGELDPVPVKIMAKIERKRAKAEIDLTDSVGQWIGRGLPAGWRLKLGAKRATPRAEAAIRDGVNGAILRTAQRFFDRGVKAWDAKASGKDMHRLRIAAKELRYSFELAGKPAGAKDQTDHWGVEQLKELQSGLGDIHDLATVRDLLWKYRGSRKMLDPIVSKQRKGIREFRELWKREYRGGAHRIRWIARATQLAETLHGALHAETPRGAQDAKTLHGELHAETPRGAQLAKTLVEGAVRKGPASAGPAAVNQRKSERQGMARPHVASAGRQR